MAEKVQIVVSEVREGNAVDEETKRIERLSQAQQHYQKTGNTTAASTAKSDSLGLQKKRLADAMATEAALRAGGNMAAADGRSQIAASQAYAKTAYRIVCSNMATHKFRPVVADLKTLQMGESLESQISQVRAERSKTSLNYRKLRDASNALGIRPNNATPATAERTALGLEMIREAVESHREEQRQGQPEIATQPATKKIYKLEASPASGEETRKRLTGMYWATWNALLKQNLNADRTAITRRALGKVRRFDDLSNEEIQTVISTLRALLKP